MLLVVEKNPKVKIPVTLGAPTKDGFQDVQVKLLIELLEDKELDALLKKAVDPDYKGNTDHELLKRCVKGWEGFGVSADKELPYSANNLKKLLGKSWITFPCVQAIQNAHAGRAEAVTGN